METQGIMFVKNNFAKIDKNGNGHITQKEIRQYNIANYNENNKEANAFIEGLLVKPNMYARICNVYDDWGRDVSQGISDKDLDAEIAIISRFPVIGRGITFVENNFDKIDKNEDGFITKDEIKQYSSNNKYADAFLESLLSNNAMYAQICNSYDDKGIDVWQGISEKDLDAVDTWNLSKLSIKRKDSRLEELETELATELEIKKNEVEIKLVVSRLEELEKEREIKPVSSRAVREKDKEILESAVSSRAVREKDKENLKN